MAKPDTYYHLEDEEEYPLKISCIDPGEIHTEIRGNKTACEISLVERNPETNMIRRNKILCGGDDRVTCEICKSYVYGQDITHVIMARQAGKTKAVFTELTGLEWEDEE